MWPNASIDIFFAHVNPLALDLLKRMLTFDPRKRISAAEALLHPYFEKFHCPDDEPSCNPVSHYDFEFEQKGNTVKRLKNLIYDEILLHHFP